MKDFTFTLAHFGTRITLVDASDTFSTEDARSSDELVVVVFLISIAEVALFGVGVMCKIIKYYVVCIIIVVDIF